MLNIMNLESLIAPLQSYNRLFSAIDNCKESNTIIRIETNKQNVFYQLDKQQMNQLVQIADNIEPGTVCCHEIRKSQIVKIYFDLDAKFTQQQVQLFKDDLGQQWETKFLNQILTIILQTLEQKIIIDKNINPRNYFDLYSSSRTDKDNYKMSWHIVLLPNKYKVDATELKCLVGYINTQINKFCLQEYRNIFSESQQLYLLDQGVYKPRGNLRLVNFAKLESQTKKKLIDQQLELKQEVMRYLVSYTQNLTFLQLMSDQKNNQPQEQNESCSPVLNNSQCSQIVEQIKQVMTQKWELKFVKYEFKNQQLFIRFGTQKECPICKRIHEKDQLYIAAMKEFIKLGCFRNDSSKGIYLDYNGQYLEIDKHLFVQRHEYISNNDDDQQDTDKIQQIDQFNNQDNLIIKALYESHRKKHENIDFNSNKIQYQQVNQEIIQDLDFNAEVQFIKSQMGTGKTKKLLQMIQTFINNKPDDKIIILSFRISFSDDHKNKINKYLESNGIDIKFEQYNEISQTQIAQSKYLIIQVESLHKLGIMALTECGLLILDESESILQQATSGLSINESKNCNILETLIQKTKQIICLDAFLSQRTVNIICSLRDQYKDLIQNNNYTEKRVFIENKWVNNTQYEFFINSEEQWINQLFQHIEEGKNIAIPCNVAIIAKTIKDLLIKKYPQLQQKICIYTQDTNVYQKQQDLMDIANQWKQYQILIYSPTILAGISFEETHFDILFGYYKSEVNSVENFLQMCGRIRNFNHKIFKILIIPNQFYNMPKQPLYYKDIDKKIQQDIFYSCQSLPSSICFSLDFNNQIKIHNKYYYDIYIHNLRVRNLSLHCPLQRFINCIGFKNIIKIIHKDKQKKSKDKLSLRQLSNNLREQLFTNIIQSENLPKEDIQILIQTPDNQLSEEQQNSLKKYQLIKQMGIINAEDYDIKENGIESQQDVNKWINLTQYLDIRKQFTTLRSYLFHHKQNSFNQKDHQLLQKQSESLRKFKLQERLLLYLQQGGDIFQNHIQTINDNNNNDINENSDFSDQSINNSFDNDQYVIPDIIRKMFIYNLIIYIDKHKSTTLFYNLKHEKSTINEIKNYITKQSFIDLADKKHNYNEIIKINKSDFTYKNGSYNLQQCLDILLQNLLDKIFGINIQNNSIAFPQYQFSTYMNNEINKIEILQINKNNFIIRQLCPLLWILPIDANIKQQKIQQPEQLCQHTIQYEYDQIKSILYCITHSACSNIEQNLQNSNSDNNIKNIIDSFINKFDLSNCPNCVKYWTNLLIDTQQLIQQQYDMNSILHLNDYNYYNNTIPVIDSIKQSLELIQYDRQERK